MSTGKRQRAPNRITASAPDRLKGSGDTWRGSNGDNGNSNARGYGHAWRVERATYLIDHPLCAIRGDGCTLAATVVDHVKPHRGNPVLFWDKSNWQATCNHCHNAHKQKIEHAARYARTSPSD